MMRTEKREHNNTNARAPVTDWKKAKDVQESLR